MKSGRRRCLWPTLLLLCLTAAMAPATYVFVEKGLLLNGNEQTASSNGPRKEQPREVKKKGNNPIAVEVDKLVNLAEQHVEARKLDDAERVLTAADVLVANNAETINAVLANRVKAALVKLQGAKAAEQVERDKLLAAKKVKPVVDKVDAELLKKPKQPEENEPKHKSALAKAQSELGIPLEDGETLTTLALLYREAARELLRVHGVILSYAVMATSEPSKVFGRSLGTYRTDDPNIHSTARRQIARNVRLPRQSLDRLKLIVPDSRLARLHALFVNNQERATARLERIADAFEGAGNKQVALDAACEFAKPNGRVSTSEAAWNSEWNKWSTKPWDEVVTGGSRHWWNWKDKIVADGKLAAFGLSRVHCTKVDMRYKRETITTTRVDGTWIGALSDDQMDEYTRMLGVSKFGYTALTWKKGITYCYYVGMVRIIDDQQRSTWYWYNLLHDDDKQKYPWLSLE